ncbi:MAG: Smr/MutS family protein [Bullifex sp.]
MGRKKDKRAAVNSRSFKKEEDEILDSPFKNIVLKEKKEEPQKKKPQVEKKKPSEIVQGYDPGASFADILSNWERTGNPYAMPHEKKKEKSVPAKQASFGDILASWDRMTDPEVQRRKQDPGRVSPAYKPTKDFGALLDQYEGKLPQKKEDAPVRRKEKDSVPLASFFREMEDDDERPSDVTWSVFGDNDGRIASPETKKENANAPVKKSDKRKSKEYKPTKDFGALLDEFEGRKPQPVREEGKSEQVPVNKSKEPEVKKPTFFREKEEDDERPAGVAWSVFGDNKPIGRPVKEEPETVSIPESETEKRISEEYKPTKNFGALLDEFEGRKPQPVREEGKSEQVPVNKNKKPEVKKPTFFREKEEDDERPAGIAWSVFGDNKPIVRPQIPERKPEKVPEESKPVSPVPRVQPKKSRLFNESVRKMPEKTFDEILKEKGEVKRKQRVKTLNELRIMLPSATLDLHGMGYTEAESEVNRFLDEALSSRIEKVAIIHGKGLHSDDGEGVLKELVYTILERRGIAREITVPKAQYGGSGAVWVILKKNTEEEPSA